MKNRSALAIPVLIAIAATALSWGPAVHANGLADLESLNFGANKDLHTDTVLILKDGKILYERYARGYDANSKHLSWSMAKSISSWIAARAIEDGKFKLEDPLAHWAPEYAGTATLKDLFQMSSGIEFKEEYNGIPVDSDATKMLYLNGPKTGFGAYTLKQPLRTDVQPGEYFYYSSGEANLIQEVTRRSFADAAAYNAYPWSAIFSPLGIDDATFEQDSAGAFVGSSYVYMTAREYARIGELVAHRGVWGQKQLIPSAFFDSMTEVAPGVMKNALPGTSPTRAYSMQITTNLPITGRGLPSEYPDLPMDSLLLIGHQGSLIIASPKEDLVIVRLATDKGDDFNPLRAQFFDSVSRFLGEQGIAITRARDVHPEWYHGQVTSIAPVAQGKPKVAEYFEVPHLILSLYAKELCSCLFVEKRSHDQCKEDLKITLPVLPFTSIDQKAGTVTTTFDRFVRYAADFKGDRLGCTLRAKP